ncbi:MAG: hypothetical protein A2487_10820 [Candidatus Raymondbacteria bacterium RifOxyC12_full_50_8]|nr:MAG: hypothetical protein A2487_10820 [Candidatus Raymondbacteria bacterium RifOxyC12_full_50_8]
MSLKKKALDAVGPFDANYRGNALYEEIDFSLRLTRKGFHIWFEPAASLTHFRADNGGCRASAGTAYLRAKFRNTGYFFSKNLSLLPGPAFFIALKNEIEFYTREKEGGHRLGEALLHFFSACRGLARGALKRLSGL